MVAQFPVDGIEFRPSGIHLNRDFTPLFLNRRSDIVLHTVYVLCTSAGINRSPRKQDTVDAASRVVKIEKASFEGNRTFSYKKSSRASRLMRASSFKTVKSDQN